MKMVIVGCFLEYDGKFLILFRHSHKPKGNTWGLPAGKVDPGEDNLTAMIRELYEETGYKATPSEISHLGDYTFGGHDNSYTFATYRVKAEKKPEIKREIAAHAETKWVTAEECYKTPNLIADLHDLLKLIKYVN